MKNDDLSHPGQNFPAECASSVISAPPAPQNAADAGASGSDSMNISEQPRRRVRRRLLLAAAVMSPVIGLSVGLATSPTASATQPALTSRPAGSPNSAGGGSNARSGPAAGGSSGTVTSVSKSSFAMTTSAGQKVTIDESSSTKYDKGTNSVSASAIKKGERILVLGTVSSTTIKASQVIVQSTSSSNSASLTAASVIPFQKGAPTTSKESGQIPASYSEGSGTIVSGTTANKATEAALAAYPGGIVDRVVKLSNGEYEVHNIGATPHLR
jgi:Domain of unknown function (DUF5666)